MTNLSNPLFILKQLQAETMVRMAFPLEGTVLDVGCGSAPYRRLAGGKVRYIGIDLVPSPDADVRADCLCLPFADASFDAVICTEVLEHVSRPADCLGEIRRVLKEGGKVYITVPQTWPLHYEPSDYWRFTRYGLERLCADSSLTVVSTARIGGVFSLIGVRMADVGWTGFSRAFVFIGRRNAERLATLVCLPWSLMFYCLGRLADRVDKRDALCWAVVARK